VAAFLGCCSAPTDLESEFLSEDASCSAIEIAYFKNQTIRKIQNNTRTETYHKEANDEKNDCKLHVD